MSSTIIDSHITDNGKGDSSQPKFIQILRFYVFSHPEGTNDLVYELYSPNKVCFYIGYIIKFFPNGIFTSVGKYSNSDVELTVKKVVLGK